jgi:hypothetical protein
VSKYEAKPPMCADVSSAIRDKRCKVSWSMEPTSHGTDAERGVLTAEVHDAVEEEDEPRVRRVAGVGRR